MLRFVPGNRLAVFPRLAASMFRDRAAQFRDRLGWAVRVDQDGWERDEYDIDAALYVIWERPDGTHGGSMRFLPTTGAHMVRDHFAHLGGEGVISDTGIWECTRFCLAEGAEAHMSAALMLGGAEVGAGFGLRQALGVFDARMVRIYRLLGWEPSLIGTEGAGRDAIGLGLWTFSEAVRMRLALRAGIAPEVSRHWFRMSLGEVARAA
jgi:acyl homoserine lactone synthase